MKKINFSFVSDVLFYGACAFVLALSVLRYFRVPLVLSLGASVAIGLTVSMAAGFLLYQKNKKRLLSRREREARDKLMLHFALEKPERVRVQLLEAFLADEKNAHCFEDELCIEDTPCVPIFTLEPVSADEVARLIRKFGDRKIMIACRETTQEAEKLLQAFGIEKLGENEIYALFERTKKTPEPLICGEVPRRTGKKKLQRAFSKSNAHPFFVSGALLLIMSLFTFFPVYYIISGSVLLLLAITTRFFGYAG